MSEYELADAFQSHVQMLGTFFFGFLSATSAYLVVVHLTSREIPKFLARITIAIYTAASIFLIASFQRQSSLLLDIRGLMKEKLPWHTAVYEPQWVMPIIIWLAVGLMTSLFVSSIWYHLHSRKKDVGAT